VNGLLRARIKADSLNEAGAAASYSQSAGTLTRSCLLTSESCSRVVAAWGFTAAICSSNERGQTR
jgi:hypothetical protein